VLVFVQSNVVSLTRCNYNMIISIIMVDNHFVIIVQEWLFSTEFLMFWNLINCKALYLCLGIMIAQWLMQCTGNLQVVGSDPSSTCVRAVFPRLNRPLALCPRCDQCRGKTKHWLAHSLTDTCVQLLHNSLEHTINVMSYIQVCCILVKRGFCFHMFWLFLGLVTV